jgi:hypothetical protein
MMKRKAKRGRPPLDGGEYVAIGTVVMTEAEAEMFEYIAARRGGKAAAVRWMLERIIMAERIARMGGKDVSL